MNYHSIILKKIKNKLSLGYFVKRLDISGVNYPILIFSITNSITS